MKPELLIGKIACACVQPKAEKIVGAVMASKDLADSLPSGIPNKLLRIRGHAGWIRDVNMLRHNVQLFDTWEQANAAKATP